MRKFLALVSVCSLGVGISHAQELSSIPAEVLTGAIAQAKLCTFTTLKISLDDTGKEKGKWTEPKEVGDVLEKFVRGDKDYVRPLSHMRGSSLLDPTTNSSRRIKAELTEELLYSRIGFTYLKLRELTIILEQVLRGEKWFPSDFELSIKYWVGVIRIGPTYHDKYKAKFDCSVAEMVTK